MNNPPVRATTFSQSRTWRYALWRQWGAPDGPYAMFIGLNPSTADETLDDPTVRRCIRYAKEFGYDALCMTNLFAYRATYPRDMKAFINPVGPLNDEYLKNAAAHAGLVVAAWGTHGTFLERGEKVRRMIPNLHCLKVTKGGHPAHPLYLKADLRPVPF